MASVAWEVWLAKGESALQSAGIFCSLLQAALLEAILQSWSAARAWWKVAVLVGNPALRWLYQLWLLALPYIRMAGVAFVEHLKAQEPKVLMSYAAIIGAIVAFFLIRRLLRRLRVWDRMSTWCRRQYNRMETKYRRMLMRLRHYSKLAAEVLPHALYALAAVGVTWLFPDTVHACSHELVLNCILIYVPGIRAFLLLQQDKQFRFEFQRSKQQQLSYWAVLAAFMGIRSFAHQLLVGWLIRLLPYVGEADLFLALWLILPFGGGALMDTYLLPLLKRHLGLVLKLYKWRDDWADRIIPIGTFLRLISDKTAKRLRDHLDDLPVLLVSLVFTMNFMMAGVGVVAVSLLYPAIGTLREIGETRQVGRGAEASRSWLQYWAVYALSRLLLWPIPLAYLLQLWYYTWLLLPHLDWFPYLDGRGRLYALLVQLYNEGGMPASARTATFSIFTSMDWGTSSPSLSSAPPSEIASDSGDRPDDDGGGEGPSRPAMPVAVPASTSPASSSSGGSAAGEGSSSSGPPEAVPYVEAVLEEEALSDGKQAGAAHSEALRRRTRRTQGGGPPAAAEPVGERSGGDRAHDD